VNVAALRPALLVAVVAGACGGLGPAPKVSGPCTVQTFYQLGEEVARRRLAWPFIIQDPDAERGVTVFFGGAGWQRVDVTITDPLGAVTPIDDIEAHAGSFFAHGVVGPGVSRFRFEDNDAGCLYEFGVEVRR
jgi:hypothetical protein